ncbi:hypothetical protein BBK36DRAFT_1136761 [Trichoderma citrinoviride]|uniref:Uncharacterized protein n=1 Tax=Trichoderma citrinoviride TaxID=58853 RepID=A0A2T4AWP9_9HYPO|nr:hypothetical protein BBK36DRAFT_1136761 [Trichoderma citrinoviride]PTB61494.1 hypothetical protein BBK36DRAFT_1136761 [Trichoderma citrinoviride]
MYVRTYVYYGGGWLAGWGGIAGLFNGSTRNICAIQFMEMPWYVRRGGTGRNGDDPGDFFLDSVGGVVLFLRQTDGWLADV